MISKFKSLVLLCLLLMAFGSLSAQNYTVNTLDDTDDGNCTAGHCSFREAINAANAYGNGTSITFSVSGTIYPNSQLPTITSGLMTIDGGSNTGDVTLDGSFAGGSSGLVIEGFNVSVYGLYIRNFNLDGIQLVNASGATIGSVAKPNVISGNGYAMYYEGATNCFIVGNRIGTTTDGMNSESNINGGIRHSNTFPAGSTMTITDNQFAGNDTHDNVSLAIQGENFTVTDNLFGTQPDGATA